MSQTNILVRRENFPKLHRWCSIVKRDVCLVSVVGALKLIKDRGGQSKIPFIIL